MVYMALASLFVVFVPVGLRTEHSHFVIQGSWDLHCFFIILVVLIAPIRGMSNFIPLYQKFSEMHLYVKGLR